jgi:pilus assembly protein CpaF
MWPDEASLRAFAVRLATAAGARLDQLHPYADFLLPGGLRAHVVLPPLAAATSIAVRVPRPSEGLSLVDLLAGQPTQMIHVIDQIVQQRLSYLISGGTGSGKTTLLAAMLAAVPADQRLVLVEDTAELGVVHPHCVHLRARSASSEGVGEVTLRTMVRQAMRMRPDRLVIGEVRGAEVLDLLAAMNTGHEGAGATIHANSAERVPHRVRSLGLLAGVPGAAVDAQFATAVQVVIHLARVGAVRKVVQVAVVIPPDGDVLPALCVAGDGVTFGQGWRQLTAWLDRK